ncbi:HEWD family protein [Halorussus marinus]|uniref:HEWD family protein n=1 Tax=Halorussus marinus TaxID=2505976 RepID=UPI00143203CC|nr:HEWD family protein [Halorussus marinus]
MAELDPPTKRECHRCGRREVWDADAANWTIANGNAGEPFCIHEWDITGAYQPVTE